MQSLWVSSMWPAISLSGTTMCTHDDLSVWKRGCIEAEISFWQKDISVWHLQQAIVKFKVLEVSSWKVSCRNQSLRLQQMQQGIWQQKGTAKTFSAVWIKKRSWLKTKNDSWQQNISVWFLWQGLFQPGKVKETSRCRPLGNQTLLLQHMWQGIWSKGTFKIAPDDPQWWEAIHLPGMWTQLQIEDSPREAPDDTLWGEAIQMSKVWFQVNNLLIEWCVNETFITYLGILLSGSRIKMIWGGIEEFMKIWVSDVQNAQSPTPEGISWTIIWKSMTTQLLLALCARRFSLDQTS